MIFLPPATSSHQRSLNTVANVHRIPAHRTPARQNSVLKPSDLLLAYSREEKSKFRNLHLPYEYFLFSWLILNTFIPSLLFSIPHFRKSGNNRITSQAEIASHRNPINFTGRSRLVLVLAHGGWLSYESRSQRFESWTLCTIQIVLAMPIVNIEQLTQ